MSVATSPLDPALFEPLPRRELLEQAGRPALSYWGEAWRRLRGSRRAVFSMAVVALLLLGALAGPLLWRQDPALQDLGLVSAGPSLGRSAVVVEDYRPWQPPAAAVSGLVAVDIPNTEYVRLQWAPLPGAEGYRVYRHEFEPGGAADLGLPLADLPAGARGYEDRLNLQPKRYWYSVVALAGGRQGERHAPLALSPVQGVALSDARFRGLLEGGVALGQTVTLEAHPLGTDHLGRDMLARLIHGARTSLFIGVVAPLLFVAIGVLYGGLAGYLGGRVDEWMMRFADFVIALPFLLFMILFRVALGIGPGESSVAPMLISMVVLSWPGAARLVRGQMLAIREEPYLQAARLMGARPGYLILRHMLPNVMGVVLVSLTFAIPGAIFAEAFLSFIGLGVVPPTPSWGSMCNDGIKTMLAHPHELIMPALCISVAVLAFNLLGDALRDALDARMRGKS